ncbi:hypothetical protein PVAP13_4KG161505 [Panicum virgatum]|uniref:Uncharacterized protein n=1 Tax=Panicum virgatum TaxID=38727 RepID=A0A8T0TRD1_PANVG|nr:hypothetical protein PVAP13_4KG161505 [Panicum virgatum]
MSAQLLASRPGGVAAAGRGGGGGRGRRGVLVRRQWPGAADLGGGGSPGQWSRARGGAEESWAGGGGADGGGGDEGEGPAGASIGGGGGTWRPAHGVNAEARRARRGLVVDGGESRRRRGRAQAGTRMPPGRGGEGDGAKAAQRWQSARMATTMREEGWGDRSTFSTGS